MSNDTLFRKSSLNSISSPDQLNDYIKVANPSVWLVLGALFVLLGAVLIWGVTGSLPTTIPAKGVVRHGEILCYMDTQDAKIVGIGQQVTVTGADDTVYGGQITHKGNTPISAAEMTAQLNSEYLTYALVQQQFAVKVTIQADAPPFAEDTLLDVRIVTERVKPIDFLLGR